MLPQLAVVATPFLPVLPVVKIFTSTYVPAATLFIRASRKPLIPVAVSIVSKSVSAAVVLKPSNQTLRRPFTIKERLFRALFDSDLFYFLRIFTLQMYQVIRRENLMALI